MKKREIPSIPKLKFKFKNGIHNNLFTNWKDPMDLLKKTHKSIELKYTQQETFKAKDFNSEWLDVGTNNNNKVPAKGKIMIKINRFVTLNKKRSNINIL